MVLVSISSTPSAIEEGKVFVFIMFFQWSILPDWLDGVLILAGGYGIVHLLLDTCDRMDRVRIQRSGRKAWW